MKFLLVLVLSMTFAFQSILCTGIDESKQTADKTIAVDNALTEKTAEPFVFVVFGATGDLTARKLLPAMYQLAHEGHLSANTAFVGFARSQQTPEQFRLKMAAAVDQYSRTKPRDSVFWNGFEQKIFYNSSDFANDQGYENLKGMLAKIDQESGTKGNRIFFLAVHPTYFPVIIEKLHEHQLIKRTDGNSKPFARVILEKPFGTDFDSAVDLQNHLSRYLEESQIYRMDHYLGKEGVQNLLALRFENALFEPLWNNKFIDHIQITLGEEIGIGSRAGFWEETGSLRDILQNHLMQLLALVAMEPPISLEAESIQEQKLKVLHAIRPIPPEKIDEDVIRGQYGPGISKGEPVPGYREEKGVAASSPAESFVAAKLWIDNLRWQGIPFYIRGGKRLAKQTTEILVVFKKQACYQAGKANALLVRIQPNAGIYLRLNAKVPGMNKELMPVVFGYNPDTIFKKTSPEAYEKLIFDAAKGDNTLYVNGEEQLAAWRLLTPVLKYWKEHAPTDFPNYSSGSWGPDAADRLLQAQGHKWQSIDD